MAKYDALVSLATPTFLEKEKLEVKLIKHIMQRVSGREQEIVAGERALCCGMEVALENADSLLYYERF